MRLALLLAPPLAAVPLAAAGAQARLQGWVQMSENDGERNTEIMIVARRPTGPTGN